MHYSWKILEWHTVDAVMNLCNCASVPCRGLIAYTMCLDWGPTGVKCCTFRLDPAPILITNHDAVLVALRPMHTESMIDRAWTLHPSLFGLLISLYL